jgi:hypothetical protein
MRLIAQMFDEQAALDVGVLPVCAAVAKAFPHDDEVCLVTWRGCSCDLVGPVPGQTSRVARAQELRAPFRSSVARISRELGSVRLLVHRHGGLPRDPCHPVVLGSQGPLTIRELMGRSNWLIEDVLLEITSHDCASRF